MPFRLIAGLGAVATLAPQHGHAVLIVYFYITVYLFNATPVPVGLLVDRLGLVPTCTVALGGFLMLGLGLHALTRHHRFVPA